MKQSFLSKFTRSLGYAPEGWPADDVAEIDAAASELKKITSDVVKKLSLYLPQTSLHNVRSLDLNYFSSESLQSSFTFGIPNDPLLNKIVKPIESRQKRCNIPQNTNDLNGAVNGLKSPENEVIEGGFCMANDVSSTSLMPKEQIKCEDSIESRFLGNCNSLRFKKMPEVALARTCLEASERLAALQPTLSHLLFGCGQASSQLAQARVNWGARVQDCVIGPMKRVAEATSHNSEMARTRRQAWRAGGELRSVSERAARAATSVGSGHNASTDDSQSLASSERIPNLLLETVSPPISAPSRKTINSQSGGDRRSPKGVPSPLFPDGSPPSKASQAGYFPVTPNGEGNLMRTAKATQLNAIKEDLEAESQLLKEKALHELFNFETMSTLECSQALVDMVEITATYHRRCAAILEDLAPLLRAELDEQCLLPVYGRNLETHLAVTHARIAYPLQQCVRSLNNMAALCEEGIFRIAGSKTKVDTLKSALNSLRAENVIAQYDPYVIADAMKQYLRSLPEPLLTSLLLDQWSSTLEMTDSDEQIRHLQATASQMPEAYHRNAGYLFRFLNRVTEFAEKNRMTPANLSIIFGPTLFAAPHATLDDAASTADNGNQNGAVPSQFAFHGAFRGVIELLIIHANEVFRQYENEDLDGSDDLTQTSSKCALNWRLSLFPSSLIGCLVRLAHS
uniref:Rho-GAP domain-containing protein n=1 Tax=Mesocestoides corti TaxID=53468 RepID=A0A5K3EQM2_MESCO